MMSKFIHVVFHTLAIGFFATALACVIIQKNYSSNDHFTTVHSWIGLAVMSVYLVQVHKTVAEETKVSVLFWTYELSKSDHGTRSERGFHALP